MDIEDKIYYVVRDDELRQALIDIGVEKVALRIEDCSQYETIVFVDHYPSESFLSQNDCRIEQVFIPEHFTNFLEIINFTAEKEDQLSIIYDYLNNTKIISDIHRVTTSNHIISDDVELLNYFNKTHYNKLAYIKELKKWFYFHHINGWQETSDLHVLTLMQNVVSMQRERIRRHLAIDPSAAYAQSLKYLESLRNIKKIAPFQHMLTVTQAKSIHSFIESGIIKFIDGILCRGEVRGIRNGDLFFSPCVKQNIMISERERLAAWEVMKSLGFTKDIVNQLRHFFLMILDNKQPHIYIIDTLQERSIQDWLHQILAKIHPYSKMFNVGVEAIGYKNINSLYHVKCIYSDYKFNGYELKNSTSLNFNIFMGESPCCFKNVNDVKLKSNILLNYSPENIALIDQLGHLKSMVKIIKLDFLHRIPYQDIPNILGVIFNSEKL